MGLRTWLPLAPYSFHVKFVEHVKEVWMRLLSTDEFKGYFPDVDPHAHFVMTVVHCLDHLMLNVLFNDLPHIGLYIWGGSVHGIDLAVTGKLALEAFAMTNGFPKLFDVYMRQSPNPFYRAIYDEVKPHDPLGPY